MPFQNVFLAATCAVMSTGLGGCASGTGPGPLPPPSTQLPRLEVGKTTTFKPHERAQLPDGSLITYEGLVNDSRCRPGVQCVWAGDAEARFTHTLPGGTREVFSLHSELQPRSKTLGAATLHLREVDWSSPPHVTVELK